MSKCGNKILMGADGKNKSQNKTTFHCFPNRNCFHQQPGLETIPRKTYFYPIYYRQIQVNHI